MGKKRGRAAGKIGKVVRAVARASPVGRVASIGGGIVSSLRGRSGVRKRRSIGVNLNKFANQLLKAKLKNKLWKEKVKGINMIK